MLRNPSFEDGWRDEGNSQVPDGWEWSFRDDEMYTRPEMRVLPKRLVPSDEWDLFFLDGDQALKVFNGQHAIRFNLRQKVTGLMPGKRYRLTMPVHLDVFTWDGRKVYCTDPNGAEARGGWSLSNFESDVIWKDWQAPAYHDLAYGEYRDVVVEFMSPESGEVTVWLECKAKWNISNNFFLDDFKLMEIGEGCDGVREPYESTVILLSPSTPQEKAHQVLDEVWERRTGFVHSADDAFMHCPDVERTVEAVEPEGWPGGWDGLQDFKEQYYPSANLVLYGGIEEVKLAYPTTHLPPYITSKFGALEPFRNGVPHCGLDLRSSWKVWGDEVLSATEGDVVIAGWNENYGGFGSRVRIRTILNGKEYLIRYAHLLMDGIYVNAGERVEAGRPLGRPDSTGKSTADHLHIDVWDVAAGRYLDPEPMIEWPEEQEPEPEYPIPTPTDRALVTGHVQAGIGALETYLKVAQPRGIKVIGWGDAVAAVGWHPGLEAILLRKWYGSEPDNAHFLNNPDKRSAAREYVDLVISGLAELSQELRNRGWNGRLGLESLNEPYCNLCEDSRKARDFEVAFCDELMGRGIPLVVPACFHAGVGNPHEAEGESILLPVARKVQEYNGFMCYHNYAPVNYGESHLEDQWEWYAGRMDWFLPVFYQHGVEVDLFFSEGGPIWGPPPKYAPLPDDGWRSSKCYNDDWPATRNFLVRLNELLQVRYGIRCYGCAVFTTGGGSRWETFELGKAEWDDLASYI